MKFFSAKLLLIPFLALNVNLANAGIYKITFATSDITNVTPEGDINGTLEGFIVIDESLADSTYSNSTSDNFINIPSWLISASFTFTNTSGDTNNPTRTASTDNGDFAFMHWKTAGGPPSFSDGTTGAEFTNQMRRLAFTTSDFKFLGPADLDGTNLPGYQIYTDEFRFDTSTTQAVPGPLPLLGLAPLAWYFRKLKNKSLKS